MIEEIYKDIQGYEGLYQISNLGNVKSLHTRGKEKILKPAKNHKGYLTVGLCQQEKQKTHYIHRLVAMAFIENPNNLPQINHKDINPANNTVENLEWCDCQYNIDYSQSKQVMCTETNKIYPSTHQVERELGFYSSGIRKCCRGKQKTCGGFHWKYVK